MIYFANIYPRLLQSMKQPGGYSNKTSPYIRNLLKISSCMTLELQNLRLSSKKRLYYYLDIEIEGSEFRLLSQSPAIFFVNSTVKP